VGEVLLEEFLKPLGVMQAAAARRAGVPFQRLNTLVKGRRGVTFDTALRLADLTGMDASFWMGLQADYDLWARAARRRSVAYHPAPEDRRDTVMALARQSVAANAVVTLESRCTGTS
jgi:addiction module HigA family antidote